jgi:uncharacterized protein
VDNRIKKVELNIVTTIYDVDCTCPLCDAEIKVTDIMSTNVFGKTTDFRSIGLGGDPLHYVISQCRMCGYADYSEFFMKPRALSDEQKTLIREKIKPPAEDAHEISYAYYTAAQISELMEKPANETADLYLKAAWCSDDEENPAQAGAYRKLAITYFEKALDTHVIKAEERPIITYLIGEQYRRVGEIDQAHIWFNKVITMNDLPEKLVWVKETAEQQRDNPQDYFN